MNFNMKSTQLCVRVLRYIVIVKYQATRIAIHREQLHNLCGFLDCYKLPQC